VREFLEKNYDSKYVQWNNSNYTDDKLIQEAKRGNPKNLMKKE
jgi:hypothetical protein